VYPLSVTEQIFKESRGSGQLAAAAAGTLGRLELGEGIIREDEDRLDLSEVIELYKHIGRRNVEYFAWMHDIYSWITLPSVSFDCRKILSEDKTKLSIFNILVDDVADNFATRDYDRLERLVSIPWYASATGDGDEYVDVARKIWEGSIASVSSYPRFKELEKVFYFDLRQVLSSELYSYLSNTSGIENPIETNFHSSYGCQVELAIDMDLMCSPAFDMTEFGPMRTIACLAQKVAHVANMLTTYPSEILERDVSSPIISLALRKGVIRKEELGDRATIPKVSKLEWVFKSKAYTYIRKVAECEKEVRSISIRGFSDYLVELLEKFEGTRSLR
jgi:hypothetical protein